MFYLKNLVTLVLAFHSLKEERKAKSVAGDFWRNKSSVKEICDSLIGHPVGYLAKGQIKAVNLVVFLKLGNVSEQKNVCYSCF